MKNSLSIKNAVYPGRHTYDYFFKFDISQLEICVLAALSEDPTLTTELIAKEDIHKRNYSDFYGVPLDKVTPEQRKFAKSRSFELQYGASAKGMAMNSGVSIVACKIFIKEYFDKYPKVAEFYDRKESEAYDAAERLKIAHTMEGGVPGYIGRYISPMGRLFSFIPYPVKYSRTRWVNDEQRKLSYSFSTPQLRNYICQGTGYDVVNIIRNNFMKKTGNLNGVCLSNEIHDEEIGTFSPTMTPPATLEGYLRNALADTRRRLVDKYHWKAWEAVPLRAELTYLEEPHQSWMCLIENGKTVEVEG